jgi:hypothetical protein
MVVEVEFMGTEAAAMAGGGGGGGGGGIAEVSWWEAAMAWRRLIRSS